MTPLVERAALDSSLKRGGNAKPEGLGAEARTNRFAARSPLSRIGLGVLLAATALSPESLHATQDLTINTGTPFSTTPSNAPTSIYHSAEVGRSVEWNHPYPGFYESDHYNTPPEGSQVIVSVMYDENGVPEKTRIVASDDFTAERLLDKIALNSSLTLKAKPRLTHGAPTKFEELVPYFFPLEDDEGAAANSAPRPKLLSGPIPVFPEELRVKNETGGVLIELKITDKGAVQSVKVLAASHPKFADATVAAAKAWAFEPARKEGRAVKSRWRIAVAFAAENAVVDWKWRVAPRPSLGAITITAAPLETKPALALLETKTDSRKELGVVIVDSLPTKTGVMSNFDRLDIALKGVAGQKQWPLRIRSESLSRQRPSSDSVLRIVNQPLRQEAGGELVYRAWMSLEVLGKQHDFGVVTYRYKPEPRELPEDILNKVFKGAATEAATRCEAYLFPRQPATE